MYFISQEKNEKIKNMRQDLTDILSYEKVLNIINYQGSTN